jgi:arylformamidase
MDWELEYNVRLRVPDRGAFHDRCRAASRDAYARMNCIRGLQYGDGPRTRIDLFPALPTAQGTPTPVLAFFHGGFWHAHERSEYAFVARPFVNAGVATALVGYDLAPQASLEAIVSQAVQACSWLQHNAAELRVDPGLLFCAGHSAGAHLAASVMNARLPTPARGGVLVSGIFDLDPLRHTSFNTTLRLTEGSARALSPSHRPLPVTGDVLVAVGAAETPEFIRQSREYFRRWHAAGRSADLIVVPEVHHYEIVLELDDPDSDLSQAAIQRIVKTAAGVEGRDRAGGANAAGWLP